MIGLVGLALLSSLSSSDGAPPQEASLSTTTPAVVLLPLLPEGTVSGKQARGVGAQVRTALEAVATDGDVRLLSTSKDDDKQADRCKHVEKCLADLAELRGADALAAGTVAPAPDGLAVTLFVVAPGKPLARVSTTLQGNDGDARRVDRLVREAVAPHALRGSIAVTGDDGARVLLDGKPAGTLPLSAPLARLPEGDHVVIVQKQGFEDFRESVRVVHGETASVKAVLRAATSVVQTPAGDEAPPPGGLPTEALVLGGIGGGLVVAGAVAGTFALLTSLDVEKRAEAQLLAFPNDSDLLLQGKVLAFTADGLYLVGATCLAGAGALWWLAQPQPEAEGPAP
jgi:hypothetical protein